MPDFIVTIDPALISSPILFLATKWLILLNFWSKSKLLTIYIALFVFRILILSFVVSTTTPTWLWFVFMRSSFFKPWTFYAVIVLFKLTYKFRLLTLIEFELLVQIYTNLGSSFNIIPVFPLSKPDVTLTRCPYLNLFAKFYKGSYNITPFIYLFLHWITPILLFLI